MPKIDVNEVLLGWEGYRVGLVRRFEAGERRCKAHVWIELIRKPGPFVCSGCGGRCERFHDFEQRWLRDLPILDAETHLCLHRFRVDCPRLPPRRRCSPRRTAR